MKKLLTLFVAIFAFFGEARAQKFSDFPVYTTPLSTDHLVGYRTAGVAGGNSQYTIATLTTYFSANVTGIGNSQVTALASSTSFGRGLLAETSTTTLKTTLGLTIGSNVEAWSANLDSWSALAPSAKANASHTHDAGDVTTGVLAIARGGNGTASPALVAGTNVTLSGTWPNITINATAGAGGYATVQDEGSSVTTRTTMNFVGSGVTVTDDGSSKTTVTIPGGGGLPDPGSNGIVARTGSGTDAARTITGTANEITLTNGDGVSANPTISLPSALTYTGKTVTGGTFNGGAFNGTLGATTPSSVVATTMSSFGITTASGGAVDGSAASLATSGAVNIDFSKRLSTQALVGATTWSFTGSPVANQWTNVSVSADSTPRVVTLPANTFEPNKSAATASFTVAGSAGLQIQIKYDGTNYQILGLPPQTNGTGSTYLLAAGSTPTSITLTNGTGLPLTTGVSGILPIANGGTGTASPALVAGSNVTITGSWPNQTINSSAAGGGTGTKTIANWSPTQNEPPAASYATFNTRNGHPVLEFDPSTTQYAVFSSTIPQGTDLSGGITFFTTWLATTATSGTIGCTVEFERDASGGQDWDSDAYGTAQTATATTVSGTSGVPTVISVNFSQAQLPTSLAAGDTYRVRIKATGTVSGAASAQLGRARLEIQ